MKFLVTLLFLLNVCTDFGAGLYAQRLDGVKFIDNTYVDNIKTVQLRVAGFAHSYPLIELGGGARLLLSFDDLNDEIRRYTYTFIHCNQDWQPSSLGALEYNSGYANDVIDGYDFSIQTLTEYVHYDLVFPNRNMRLERSGNYLLVVYDSEGREDIPVITRRFMVYESAGGVGGQIGRTAAVDKIKSHQEVDLSFNTKQLRPRAPLQELSATVIQNGRWDNAVYGIQPNLLGRESVNFNYQGRVVFDGGNEFRNLDIRSIVAPRTKMASITNEGEFYAMMLEPENERANSVYLQYVDFNGDFVIDGSDQRIITLRDNNFAGLLDFDFSGEYVEVTFVLKAPEGLDGRLFIFGALSEWQIKPTHRMVWNPGISAYVGRILLKQGFHNYLYVTTADPKETGAAISYERTEDSFNDTENDYLGLIYYRPLGGRYDRLVGFRQLNSNAD